MHAQRVPGNKRLNLDRDGFDAPMSPPFAHGGEGYAACSRTLSTLRGLLGQSLVWQNWRVSIWMWFMSPCLCPSEDRHFFSIFRLDRHHYANAVTYCSRRSAIGLPRPA